MNDGLLREIETTIDKGHLSLPILQYPPETALYGVLAAFDSDIITEMLVLGAIEEPVMSIGQVQLFKFLSEGFSFAIQKFLNSTPENTVRPTINSDLISKAHDLVSYGANYYRACGFYSAYSQGLATAEVIDAPGNVVRFNHLLETDVNQRYWGFADEVSNSQFSSPEMEAERSYLELEVDRIFERVSYRLQSGRIALRSTSILRSAPIRRYTQLLTSKMCFISSETAVNGFSFGDFTSFWKALYSWSMCATKIYLRLFKDGRCRDECMPTQIVPRGEFIKGIAYISEVPATRVEKIVELLRTDRRTKRPDMFLQPLICGNDKVAWSVRCVQLSGFQRNLLKLLARMPSQKALADRIIGSQEATLLVSLRTALERRGWKAEVNQVVYSTEQFEIDLLGWNPRHPHELLIVETKALLHADEPNEVRTATREMEHGQRQAIRARRLLSAMPEEGKAMRFPFVDWSQVSDVFCAVVTPEGEAGKSLDYSEVPVCSMRTLQVRLTEIQWESPSSLLRAMVQREWHRFVREGDIVYEQVQLSGITFEFPMIKY